MVVIPALGRQAPLGDATQGPRDERVRTLNGRRVRDEDRPDDGAEGAVERVGPLGRSTSRIGVDLLAQLVPDRPGDDLDDRQGLNGCNGSA